jgi:hypothetical protein
MTKGVRLGAQRAEAVDAADLRTAELLRLFCGILSELRRRGVIRSSNNPVADYTERLVATALSLDLQSKSTTGFDGADRKGKKYEIKGRRVTKENRSTQLGVIRGLEQGHFDYLAGVLFSEDFAVTRACLVPREVVLRVAKYRPHVNGWILHLRPSLWTEGGVRDISESIRAAERVVCA